MQSDLIARPLDEVLAQLGQSGQHPAVVRLASPAKTALDAWRRPYVIAQRADGTLVVAGFDDRFPEAGDE